MTENLHPEVAALLERYRAELRDTVPSDALDARIERLVARPEKESSRRPRRLRRARFWALAACVTGSGLASGIFIGMRLERAAPGLAVAQDSPLPADFSLWPADSVALQIPAEYNPQGTLVAVDPGADSSGKRYWIDVVVSNDGMIRIDRIVPANDKRENGVPDGITLQTP